LDLQAVDHVHQELIPDNVLMQVADQEWLDRDQDQFVQVLQRVRNNVLMVHNVLKVAAEDLGAHQHLHRLIALKVAVHNVLKVAADLARHVLVVQVKVADQVVQDQELVAHLVKAAERKRITRVRKLVVKRSTICKRQQLVVRLFHAEMAILQSVYVAALH
jgi:hypothetical protein